MWGTGWAGGYALGGYAFGGGAVPPAEPPSVLDQLGSDGLRDIVADVQARAALPAVPGGAGGELPVTLVRGAPPGNNGASDLTPVTVPSVTYQVTPVEKVVEVQVYGGPGQPPRIEKRKVVVNELRPVVTQTTTYVSKQEIDNQRRKLDSLQQMSEYTKALEQYKKDQATYASNLEQARNTPDPRGTGRKFSEWVGRNPWAVFGLGAVIVEGVAESFSPGVKSPREAEYEALLPYQRAEFDRLNAASFGPSGPAPYPVPVKEIWLPGLSSPIRPFEGQAYRSAFDQSQVQEFGTWLAQAERDGRLKLLSPDPATGKARYQLPGDLSGTVYTWRGEGNGPADHQALAQAFLTDLARAYGWTGDREPALQSATSPFEHAVMMFGAGVLLRGGFTALAKASASAGERLGLIEGAAAKRAAAEAAARAEASVLRAAGNCFAVGTPLLTTVGARAVETLAVGDFVLSRSEHDASGEVVPKVVEEVFASFAETLEIHLAGKAVRATVEHPFWVVGKGWQPARSLEAGDRLLGHDNQTVAVERVVVTKQLECVYNIRVADCHTYFIGCNEWGFSFWAHNASVVETSPGSRVYNVVENGVVSKSNLTLADAEVEALRINGKDSVTVVRSTAATPEQYLPNSVYERLDVNGNLANRTYYDGAGRVLSREDWIQKARHRIDINGIRYDLAKVPHEHAYRQLTTPDGKTTYWKEQVRILDASGRPITDWVNAAP